MKTHDCDGEKTQKYFNELCSVFYESGFEQEQIEDMVNLTYIPLFKEEGQVAKHRLITKAEPIFWACCI